MILGPSGPRLAAVAHAVPRHVLDPAGAAAALVALFPDEDPAFVRRLIEGSGIGTRYLVSSVEEILSAPDFEARNETYRHAAVELGVQAAGRALDRADLRPSDVDCLIDVSCTGIAIPALDVNLAPRLGLDQRVRRVPITESGCAAGALGLGLAASLAAGGQRVLLVAVELCTLSLCPGDRSRASLVSSVLFGDGAAAAVLLPEPDARRASLPRPMPRIEATGSHLIPDSRETMGFDIGSHGMRIVLKRELPDILNRHLGEAADAFLATTGRTRRDITRHLVHPGGRRILDGYEDLFGLPPDALHASREALRRFGNLSSASILTVLELALEEPRGTDWEGVGLVTAVGPGLSLEFALLVP